MEDLNDLSDRLLIRSEEEEEEFRSCLGEEDDPRDPEELVEDGSKEDFDENAWKIFFKGASINDSDTRLSGIGVVMERSKTSSVDQYQKKLEFYVEENLAELLALLDALMEALRREAGRVYAFTDSEIIYDQIARGERLENKLIAAFRERILEHANKLEFFILKLTSSSELKEPLRLSQEAMGLSNEGDGSIENCPICYEEKKSSQMNRMKCSHRFCSNCLIKYVDGKIQAFQLPIQCPLVICKYCISATECKSFLPAACYESLERALMDADIPESGNMYCPYPDCSVLLNTHQCLSTRASASSQSESTCVECTDCRRLICIDCVVPWHALMTCEEYQNIPIEERDAEDITLHRLSQNQRWRRCRQCQQCRRMIELTQGCYHMTCWCGHEFCYACGAEYRDGQQTCQCAFWDNDNFETLDAPSPPEHDPEPWRWDSFNSLPDDRYSEQERSQLALIQRFLAGGFSSLSDHPSQSPPRCSDSYVDTMKDLHQLPWLERFVSVISDNYYDDYVQ